MLSATLFAIDEVNEAGGVDGRELIPIHLDPAGDPAAYGKLANRLLTNDGVRILFGCYMSSARKAVRQIVERRHGLLFYPAQYEGFEFSRNIIYCGAAPNQNSATLGKYLINNIGKNFYMVGSDYIWPRESDRIMSEMVSAYGGQVVGRRYLDLNAARADYEPLIADIKQKQPEVIFCNFVGDAIAHFYRAYADAGLDPARMPIASLTTSEADVQAMGIAPAVGHITSATYFQAYDGDENKRCLERYARKIGGEISTNMCWEAAYFQMHIAAEGLRKCGTDDPESLRAAILGAEFEAPQGRVRIDPNNAHTHVWPKVGRVKQDGQFEILARSPTAVEPEPYQVSYAIEDVFAEATL